MADMLSTTTAIRSYRIYLRDAIDALAQPYDADLASDEEAHELATRILDRQAAYPRAEVWDRARLVCTVQRGE